MSPKMKHILRAVATATPGAEPTMDELVEAFGSGASKQAMQSTIRLLEKRGLLERHYECREGRVRLVLKPTTRGGAIGRSLPP